jgi:inner membrane protein
MSHVIIDLAAKRSGIASQEPLLHPSGVQLPFDGPSDAALIIPEIRSEIRSGSYSADLVGLLPEAMEYGDRVLVIGAGLGVVSSLVARSEGVDRVIAIEANTALIPYLERVHKMNNVDEIETVNAVLAEGKTGRVPFFARRDLRTSSLLPHDRSWQQVMMVPFMDVNLILTEEQISLIICDIPVVSAQVLAGAELISVDRILVNCADDPAQCWEDDGICALLVTRGYLPKPVGNAVLFRRADALGLSPRETVDGRSARGKEAAPEDGPKFEADDDLLDEDEIDFAAQDEENEQASGFASYAIDEGSQVDKPRAEASGSGLIDFVSGNIDDDEDGAAQMEEPQMDAPQTGAPQTDTPILEAPQTREPVAEAPQSDTPETEPLTAPGETPDVAAPTVDHGMGGASVAPTSRRRRGRRRAKDRHEPVAPKSGENRAGRLWGLILLAVSLALPLILIDKIAYDRAGNRAEIVQQVGATWGGAQTLTGPFLVIPVEVTRSAPYLLGDGTQGSRLETVAADPLVLLPKTLQIDSDLNTELRRRSVFETPVYHGRHSILLNFDTSRMSGARLDELLGDGEAVLWDQAQLGVGITEPWALKGALTLNGPNGPVGFESGSGFGDLTGIHARTGDPRTNTGDWRFDIELDGSQQFLLTPAGRVTKVRMHSDWAYTNFSGAFQPTLSQTGETGFVAEWSVPQMAHALPQAFRGTNALNGLQGAGFGVDLLQGADLYHGTQRAAKFGFLLLVLTFGAIFLMEKTSERPPHLMQYALIGVAQCAFFALFLSLAELIGMGPAYALAAVATVILLTGYTAFGMGLGQRSAWLAAALGLLYGVMYLVLSTEENVLLMGAVLAFLGIAVTMWGTRNEDWGTALRGLWPEPATEPDTKPTES